MFLRGSAAKRIACFAAAVCALVALSGCAAEDGGVDKTAPYVTVGGQQVETMTFSQDELIGRAEYPPVFAIYLNEHVPLETSIGREVLFDLSQYGPATLIIEDFLLDEKGDIRYEQLRMNTTLDVPYYKTSNVYPLVEHSASVISSVYEAEVLRGICVRTTNESDNMSVFVLKVDRTGG